MNNPYDVIIIGAGPAGLSAAIYTGRGRLKTLVIEKGMPGGQILMTDWIENFPGFPEGIAPFDLMQDFQKQAERFGAETISDTIHEIRKENNSWVLAGSGGRYTAKSVIIATGSDYRKLGVDGEERLTGKGVSYCATCDAAFFSEKIIAVVGGGDNALTEVLFLAKFGRELYLIHRRDQLRGEKILQERVLAHEKIRVVWDTVIEKILGEGRVESLQLRNVKDDGLSQLNVDGLFVSIGTRPNTEFVEGFIELDEWNQIRVGREMETRKKGIFAAGDVTNACPKQMITAAGTGAHAALSVIEYIQNLG